MIEQRYTYWLLGVLTIILFEWSTAWGYYFDDRREMSLSGFAYTRAVFATQDGIAGQKNTYYEGNLVSHRNFLTLEWRHNLGRPTREFPTVGPFFQFLNFDAFDYYLNLRTEYDGVYDYGPNKIKRILGGTRRQTPYWDDPNTPEPNDGLYFTPGASPRIAADTLSLSNRRWARNLRSARVRLFEWYFNITKGPLFLRIGRQNLSWGETDAFRLLDQINPLDSSFGGFLTSLDERRIPLNMLRAQWSFGTVGPISDLTLEGFYSVDNETNVNSSLPTSSTFFWNSPQNGNTPIMYGRTPCGGDFMAKRGIPARPEFGYRGSGPGPNHGGGCSQAGDHPKSNLTDGRGGGRIVGTISDFTFSIAHYYTYQDIGVVRANIISPTPDHLAWDFGSPVDAKGRPWTDNPWGVSDPVAARLVSLCNAGDPRCNAAFGMNAGRGALRAAVNAPLAAAERNVRSTLNFQKFQVTGASLSFPVNALTGMFVGSDNPLYYLYTTVRSEIAFFNNYPTMRAYANGDDGFAIQRYLGIGTLYGPDGPLRKEAGRRQVHTAKRDWLLWNIGLDHNQWIHFLNPSNSFTFSAQQFWVNRNGQATEFDRDQPFSPLNDKDVIAGRKRRLQNLITDPAKAAVCEQGSGSGAGCSLWNYPGQDLLTTFVMSTQYMGGNLRPSFTFFYDWSGSYLIQPGIDWTFWDPFRASMRYNYLEGRGNEGLGIQNRKDSVWFELQYLLY